MQSQLLPVSAHIKRWKAEWAALKPEERYLGITRGMGVLILVGVPLFLVLYPESGIAVRWPGARFVWTLLIAFLPFVIVAIGFYTWRQICPLAFCGRMSEWIQWPDQPATREDARRRGRVPKWLARHYPLITWGFLAVMLALRLLLINSNATALALSFLGLMLLAALTSFRYTGKTWCNFFCPVSTIELIYTDADRPQYRSNSQCARCTGCKTMITGGLCPDINQENNYWQEIHNPARAFSYYALPGLILGFYLWYFLHLPYYWHQRQGRVIGGELVPVQQPGTIYDWGYYLSGDWTRDPRPWTHWLAPGFGFHGWPYLPTFLAAPLTLALLSAISFALFKAIETIWFRFKVRRGMAAEEALEAVRHPLFAAAGFAAFTLFYAFAGAPTLRHLPWGLYGLFQFAMVALAAWILQTRLSRSREKQLRFDQARKWVRKWPFPDESPPLDLEQAYTRYTLHMQSSAERLRAFKEAVRHTLGENLVTHGELRLLDRLAVDLGVPEGEQNKILREISKEAPELFDPRDQGTLRGRLHLIAYRGELERTLAANRGVLPGEGALAEIQARCGIQPAEHEAVIAELRNPEGPRARHLRRELEELVRLRGDAAVLAGHAAASVSFLRDELGRRLADDGDHVLQMASLFGPAGELDALRSGAREEHTDPSLPQPIAAWLRRHLPAELAEAMVSACAPGLPAAGAGSLEAFAQTLLRVSHDGDVSVRAAALDSLRLVLGEGDTEERAAARARLEEALHDPQSLCVETAVAALAPQLSHAQWTAVLEHPAGSVRRTALQRLPRPVPAGIADLLPQNADDPVERAALAAVRTGESDDRRGSDCPLPSGMTTFDKMLALRGLAVLAEIPADPLRYLAEHSEEAVFGPGEALCREGESGDCVYLVIQGQAEYVTERGGEEIRLGTCQPGECIGEFAALGGSGARSATVRALAAPVRALIVPGESFRHLLGRNPAASLRVMRLIIDRQRRNPADDRGS